MESKKILITSHTANFSKFNQSLMTRLKKEDYTLHYASAGDEPVLNCDKHFTVPFERNPLKIKNIKAFFELKKIINDNSYDIIHTHTPMGSVVTRLAANKARKMHKTKVIYTAHGFHFFKGAPIINWLVYYPIEKILAKYTDILITINKEDYNLANKKFKTQVRFIPGVGINLDKFKPVSLAQKNKLREKHGLSESDIIFIYAAEYNDNKNQKMLIKYFKHLIEKNRNIKLLLCGQGKNHEKYTKLINNLDLNKNIQLTGYINDINEFYQLSDICVSSSKREGQGLNLIEAMSCGLPIIANNNRGHREVINNNINGFLFNLHNKDDFNKFAKIMLNNIDLRESISKNNIRDSKKYNCNNINNEIIDIYKNRTEPISISVVIPAYNCEATIDRALYSVINQSNTENIKEIVIVNDGSTDKTADIIKEFINNNDKIAIKFISQNNAGVSKARNAAINIASGNWIAFLDADDFWNNDKIQEQLTYIKKYSNINFISSNSNKIKSSQGKLIEKGLRKINAFSFLLVSRVLTSSVLVQRRVIIDAGLFDESKKYAEDQNLFMKIAYKKNLYHINKNLVTLNDKPVFGHSGLSGDLNNMHLSCINNMRMAHQLNYINTIQYLIVSNFENIKYFRRKLVSRSIK